MSSGAFLGAFNPKKDERDMMIVRGIINVTMFFAAGISAVLWNKLLINLPLGADGKVLQGTGATKGLLHDAYNGGVPFLFSLKRHNMRFANDQTTKATQISVVTAIWFSQMQLSAEASLAAIVNVTSKTKTVLPNALTDGKFLPNNNANLDIQDFYGDALAILNSVLIPVAWTLLQQNYYPFVAETDDTCTSDDDVDVSSLTKKMMSEKVAKKSVHCINGRAYYLVSASPRSECGPGSNCDPGDNKKYNIL